MAIAGLGGLNSAALLQAATSGAVNRSPLQSQTRGASGADSGASDSSVIVSLSPADFSNSERVLQALPPGTVAYGTINSASASASLRSTAGNSSAANEADVESDTESTSYDISYSTPLQTLQSLGLLQPGDILTSSSVQMMAQQARQTTTQSASVTQQENASGASAQTSSTLSTQASTGEQNLAMLVRQNWMTPDGTVFVEQEMVRVNQVSQTNQVEGNTSSTAPDSLASLAQAIAASLSSMSGQLPAAETSSNPTSAANAPLAATPTPAGIGSTMAPGADTSSAALISATSGNGGDATTESLLTLIESLNGSLRPQSRSS